MAKMFTTKYAIVVIFVFSIFACSQPVQQQEPKRQSVQRQEGEPPKTARDQILGAWQLQTINGQSPISQNIESYQVQFLNDNTWSYSAKMGGVYQGMEMKGSGTWELNSDTLQYVAGANHGQCKVTLRNDLLTVSPDPVISPNGKEAAVTIYARK